MRISRSLTSRRSHLPYATIAIVSVGVASLCATPVAAQKKPGSKAKSTAARPAAAKKETSGINPLFYGLGALLVLGSGAALLRGKKKKPAAAAKATSNEFTTWRTLAEQAGLGVAETNAQGQITRANTALSRLLGTPVEALHGQSLERFAIPDDAVRFKELWAELRADKIAHFQTEHALYRPDGQPFHSRLTVARAGGPGAIHGVGQGTFAGILFEDTTRRHRAESGWQEARAAIHDLSSVIASEENDLAEKMRSLLAMGCRRFALETGVLCEFNVTSEPSEGALPRSVNLEIVQAVSPDERIRRGLAYEMDVATGQAAGAPPGLASLTRVALAGEARPQQATNDRGTVLGVLVSVSGQIYGALNFSSITPHPTPFGESDLEVLQLMAQWIGGEIERFETRAALASRQEELETKQMELLAANAQLEALATTDGLTGLKNRRSFDQRLEEEFLRARRYGMPVSLILMDVDKFKQYNDSFGHPAGDEVLKGVAKILQDGIRATDFAARYGGEEFALILTGTEAPGAMILADRIRIKIEESPWPNREVTASMGVSTFRPEMKARAEMTASADAALYAAKAGGRNCAIHAKNMPAPSNIVST